MPKPTKKSPPTSRKARAHPQKLSDRQIGQRDQQCRRNAEDGPNLQDQPDVRMSG
jgi:hypothetical protein